MPLGEMQDWPVIPAEQHRLYDFTKPVTPLAPYNEETYQNELLGMFPDISEARIVVPGSLIVKAGLAAAGLVVAFDLMRSRRKNK